jgi:hypothetical protein
LPDNPKNWFSNWTPRDFIALAALLVQVASMFFARTLVELFMRRRDVSVSKTGRLAHNRWCQSGTPARLLIDPPNRAAIKIEPQ